MKNRKDDIAGNILAIVIILLCIGGGLLRLVISIIG